MRGDEGPGQSPEEVSRERRVHKRYHCSKTDTNKTQSKSRENVFQGQGMVRYLRLQKQQAKSAENWPL